MKKLLILGFAAVCLNAHAVVVCETDKQGRTCCWDVDRDGTQRPWTCG